MKNTTKYEQLEKEKNDVVYCCLVVCHLLEVVCFFRGEGYAKQRLGEMGGVWPVRAFTRLYAG